jgi:hypothetical protein
LVEVDAHCAAVALLVPPKPLLAEESLRAYAVLLSGHFQGFCRDLYTECAQIIASRMPVALQITIQTQLTAELNINSSNPTVDTIRNDFQRFAFTLDFNTDPANGPRVTHLGHLNKWRNTVAHQKPNAPAGVPALTLSAVQSWRASCDGLAVWLDAIMYNQMIVMLGTAPW